MWLAMTTNERLNAHRYKYFHSEDQDKEVGHSHDDGEKCKHQPKSPFKWVFWLFNPDMSILIVFNHDGSLSTVSNLIGVFWPSGNNFAVFNPHLNINVFPQGSIPTEFKTNGGTLTVLTHRVYSQFSICLTVVRAIWLCITLVNHKRSIHTVFKTNGTPTLFKSNENILTV